MESLAGLVPRYYNRIQVLLYRMKLSKGSASIAQLAPVDVAGQLQNKQYGRQEFCFLSLLLYEQHHCHLQLRWKLLINNVAEDYDVCINFIN